MWSSIEQIIKPESFEEALVLQEDSSSTLFAGGSYVVAKKDLRIQTLLDINHLLSDSMENLDDGLHLGSGITLQQMLTTENETLSKAIKSSCPSKNIRNQRTLGGEIAESRPDSDLLGYLNAAGTMLQLNDTDTFVSLNNWPGQGVITRVHIPKGNIKIERVAVLDSAPAFVIAALLESSERLILAVGGKSSRICTCETPTPPGEADIRHFMDEVESIFVDDHLGSSAYKRQLVSNLFHEISITL